MLEHNKKITTRIVIALWLLFILLKGIDILHDERVDHPVGFLNRAVSSAKYLLYNWRLNVDVYIMTSDEVSNLYKRDQPSLLMQVEPKVPLYAVIRVKNNTGQKLVGTLYCEFSESERYLLDIKSSGSSDEGYIDSVIPIKPEGKHISTRWKYLYFNEEKGSV
jgi:hypothetical protein